MKQLIYKSFWLLCMVLVAISEFVLKIKFNFKLKYKLLERIIFGKRNQEKKCKIPRRLALIISRFNPDQVSLVISWCLEKGIESVIFHSKEESENFFFSSDRLQVKFTDMAQSILDLKQQKLDPAPELVISSSRYLEGFQPFHLAICTI